MVSNIAPCELDAISVAMPLEANFDAVTPAWPLVKGTPAATRRRPSTPVEVVLRLLVVKHLYHWSCEETEHFLADSLVLRQLCRVYLAPVPDDTTLLRWAQLIEPVTLAALNERVVGLACSKRGR